MTSVNPIMHMDKEFMWRWFETDDLGQAAFVSAKSFFYLKECEQDYVASVQRITRRT